ncbi:hypothetical protein AB205_0024860, partial [Aquarana catesbeiana]
MEVLLTFLICLLLPGLLCMMIISVSSGTVYVQSGSDITGCHMKCPEDDVTVELYRQCRGEDRTLLENHCYYNFTKSHDPRLQLDTGSGCWKLTRARKDDSCVYKMWCHCAPGYVISSTEIRVLDPVLVSNISSNGSRLGEDAAVSVQFSGEESAVTWEVDGEPLPERYQMIDDNRTLIIPSVQRDDAERRFRVRITNPVSEEFREYRLINDTMFIRMLQTEDYEPDGRPQGVTVAIFVVAVLIITTIMGIIYMMHRKCSRNRIPENGALYISVPQHNGSVPAVTESNEPEAIPIQNGSVPTVPENEEPEAILIQNGSVPAVPENEEPEAILIQNGSVPAVTK